MLFSSPSSMAAYITCGSGPLKSQDRSLSAGALDRGDSTASPETIEQQLSAATWRHTQNPIEQQSADADLEGDAGADLPVVTKRQIE